MNPNDSTSAAKKIDANLHPVKPLSEKDANLPAEKTPQDNFSAYLKAYQSDFKMLLPQHIKPERILRLALATVRRTPQLLNCSVPSIMAGLMDAAALGLECNTPLAQAYLVPFKNNKTRTTEAQLIIGYQGLVQLFYNSGKVNTVFANTVRKEDIFSYSYGIDEQLKHIPSPMKLADRGPITHFYAYAKMHANAYRFTVLTVEQVNHVRDTKSQSYAKDKQNSPWTSDYEAMGRKTAVRDLAKWLPRSAEVQRAIEADYTVVTDPLTDVDFQTRHNPDASTTNLT